MNIKLITELPAWWILVCFLAGILYATVLYRRSHSFDGAHNWLRRLLFAIRALAVFILSILLLTPLIKTIAREKEKPVLIVAQDNSESIVMNKDSSFYRTAYKDEVSKMLTDLEDKYDVRRVSWGDRVTDNIDFSFSGKQTDFSTLQKQLGILYGNRNVGAIVVASDGLYNRGGSPLYNETLKVPIYTIALGDTTVQKDALISRVNFNKVVFSGNTFPVEVTVNARQCSGEKTTLTLTQDTATLFSRAITISGNRFSQLIPIMLEAKKPGLVHYKLKLSSVSGEMTLVNNVKDIYVEVIDSKQKVLIVCNAPHPDVGALKEGIESSQNYSAKVVLASQQVQVKDYNLVILHNLPSRENPAGELLSQLKSTATPVWFIVGGQTSISHFNNAAAGVNITGGSDKSDVVHALVNSNYSRFTVSDEMKRMMPVFPPLHAPFGEYRSTTDNAVLLHQKIGSIGTDKPLHLFNDGQDGRRGVLFGEGLWRWRISDYAENGNYNVFQEWLLKTIQNLSVKEVRNHFRVVGKNNFAENEPVIFDAEVYNDNYELINTPDVSITLVNRDEKSFPYTFSKTDKGYTLNAGFLPAGQYRYKAGVKVGSKMHQATGEFSVTELQVEQTETVADHQLMYALAGKSGGDMYFPSQLGALKDALLSRDDKVITFSHYKLRDLVDWKLIFFIVLGLLTMEWFLRKRAGAY